MDNIEKCINYLKEYNNFQQIITLKDSQTFRALMNLTMPINLSDEFYQLQDQILQEQLKFKTIIDVDDLTPLAHNIYLWQGDITTIKADAIVNACNCKLLGCFQPLHHCIDNEIHSAAGLQVRRDLLKIMEKQNHDEENGKAKITKAYNLPSRYIFHTVGPIVFNAPTKQNEVDLYNCYQSCLKLADYYQLKSIVFCSISTGLYGYPIQKASQIALKSVKNFLNSNLNTTVKKIVFNVFSRGDYDVYYKTIKKINRRS